MKKILIAALTMLCSSAAFATYCPDGSLIASHPNGDCSKTLTPHVPTTKPPGESTNTNSNSNTSGSKSISASQAAALAKQHQAQKQAQQQAQTQNQSQQATGTGTGTGVGTGTGTGTATANGQNTNTLGTIGNSTDQSSSSFRALALTLPTLAFTPPLPNIPACSFTNTKQSATGVLMGVYSGADASINTDHCYNIELYNGLITSCRYASAYNFYNEVLVERMPKFKPGEMSPGSRERLFDLSGAECAGLKQPVIINTGNDRAVDYLSGIPSQAKVKACVVPTKKPIAKSKKAKKKCTTVCCS